jgi:hypothetical protein
MKEKDELLIELADYCCEKLRQIDGELVIAKANEYNSVLEKTQHISKIEAIVITYMELIKKLNEIKDRDIQFSKN